jgi:hypothetical protein
LISASTRESFMGRVFPRSIRGRGCNSHSTYETKGFVQGDPSEEVSEAAASSRFGGAIEAP